MKEDLLKIINHYGIGNQLKKFNEESFEFMEAIIDCENHLGTKEHVTEEVADVFVLIGQFIIYYNIEINDVDKIMWQKINRQLKRMEEENVSKVD